MVDSIKTAASKVGNNGLIIYVPKTLSADSKNPIKIGDPIRITVDGVKMVIEKCPE